MAGGATVAGYGLKKMMQRALGPGEGAGAEQAEEDEEDEELPEMRFGPYSKCEVPILEGLSPDERYTVRISAVRFARARPLARCVGAPRCDAAACKLGAAAPCPGPHASSCFLMVPLPGSRVRSTVCGAL